MFVECADDELTEHACPVGYYWSDEDDACSDTHVCDSLLVPENQTTPCLPDGTSALIRLLKLQCLVVGLLIIIIESCTIDP